MQLRGIMLRIFWTALVATLVAQSAPTPLLDLTNTSVRDRLRQPVTASGSGHLTSSEAAQRPSVPIALQLLSLKKSGNPEKVIAEVELRNTSRLNLEIPVDPSSRDFEPVSPSISYRYLTAYVWLAAEPEAEQRMASTGLHLYGSRQVPTTLRVLKPGESLRIRASVPMPPMLQSRVADNRTETPAIKIRAFLAIFDEWVTPEADGLHSSTQQNFPTIASTTAVDSP